MERRTFGRSHGGDGRRRGSREAEEGALPGREGEKCGVAGWRAQSAHARARPGSGSSRGGSTPRSIEARQRQDRVRLLAGWLAVGVELVSLGCYYIGIWVGFSLPRPCGCAHGLQNADKGRHGFGWAFNTRVQTQQWMTSLKAQFRPSVWTHMVLLSFNIL